MSRIAANETYGGNMLRKAIDYFSHLAVDPKWYPEMTKDEEFAKTDYAPKLKWLKDDNDDIYDPDYSDMLRVAFMSQYPRGKMKDLVSLLQGRDFETKDFKESIAEETFKNLSNGVLDYMNEYNFKQFVLAIKDAGFISKKLITSDITLDFAYLDTPTNIAVGKDEPCKYFAKVFEQCKTGEYHIGNLKSEEAIKKNLADNCIPIEIKNWTFKDYEKFLTERRKLMAAKIRAYYEKL